ncbi:MAG: hypothetical protein WBZ36_26720 [Candidatus Nitrosopolaris sp.]
MTITAWEGNTFAVEGRLMSNNQGMEGATITFTGKEVLQHPDSLTTLIYYKPNA